jgi:hypothetical protein
MTEIDFTQKNLRTLIQKITVLPYVLAKLEAAGIRYGLYAGSHVAALTNNRVPTDVDLLVHDADLTKLCQAFPFAKTKDLGNGGVFLYVGNDDIIECMGRADLITEGTAYPFRLTDASVSRLTSHTIDGLTISLVDPVDTILLKAILQRGAEQGKHDLEDIAAILAKINIDEVYLGERLRESGAADRTSKIWKKYGIKTS